MPALSLLRSLLMAVALMVAAAMIGGLPRGFAPQEAARAEAPLRVASDDRASAPGEPNPGGVPHWRGRDFLGIQSCYICHSKTQEGQRIPGLPGVRDDGWALLNEVTTWGTSDKHYQAYVVLLNERSQEMARIMGVVDENGESQIHRDVRCLTCHSGMPVDQMQPDERGLVPVELTNDTRLNLGVSCESCHGAAGEVDGGGQGWATLHYIKDRWRFLPPEEKWHQHGYYDVRSPASRARLCVSCHVGSAEEGRVVTHEMYAAGHPPLPAFEIESFIDQMPAHWREFGHKSPQVREEFLERTGAGWDPDHLDRTRKLLVGGLVNLGESLRLTADLADASVEMPVERPEWPELAQFACYACHHDLRVPAWRQERGYFATPGRPIPHEWPSALLEPTLQTAGRPPAELDTSLHALRRALDLRPFGHPDRLPDAARALVAWADDLAAELERRPVTRADGQALLRELARIAASETVDYDAARKIVWAFRIIYRDLQPQEPGPFNPGANIGWYPEPDGLDPIEHALADVGNVLLLDLRKGRRTGQRLEGEDEDRPVVESDLKLVLPPIADYEPDELQRRFREIVRLLE